MGLSLTLDSSLISGALGGVSKFVPDPNPLGLVAINDRHGVPGSSNQETSIQANTTQHIFYRKVPSNSASNQFQFMDCGYRLSSGDGEVPYLYGYTVTRTIEVAGVRYQCTWGGATSVFVSPGSNVYSDALTLPSDVAAGGAYIEHIWKQWDFRKPTATLVAPGGIPSGINITDGGKNINLSGVGTLLSATGLGGSGATITWIVTNGVLTGATFVGGTGYTNGVNINFTGGAIYYENGSNGNSTYGDRLNSGNGLADLTVTGNPAGTTLSFGVQSAGVFAKQITSGQTIGVLGTSETWGIGDTIDSTGRLGYVERSIAGAKGLIILSRSGVTLQSYLTSAGTGRKKALLRPGAITHLIFELLTNDIYFGSAYPDLGSLQTAMRQALAPYIAAGIKVFPVTVGPYTTGTFTSAGGQVQGNAAGRALANSLNAWMLTVGTAATEGWAGVIDFDGTMRDPASTDVWRSDGGIAQTGDGLHANAVGVATIISAGICAASIFT